VEKIHKITSQTISIKADKQVNDLNTSI